MRILGTLASPLCAAVLLACGEGSQTGGAASGSGQTDSESMSAESSSAASRECELPVGEDGWCIAPPMCELASASCSNCCLDAECCDSSAVTSFSMDNYECVLRALQAGAPAALTIQYVAASTEFLTDRIIVLGNGRAELNRTLAVSGRPGIVETAIVQLKDDAFFETCLALGIPGADPCLAIECTTRWFDPASCDHGTCCLQPSVYEGELCP